QPPPLPPGTPPWPRRGHRPPPFGPCVGARLLDHLVGAAFQAFKECLDAYTAGGGGDADPAEQPTIEGSMRADDPNRHLQASAGTAMDSARIRDRYLSGKLSTADYERLIQERRGPQLTPAQRRIAVPWENMFGGGGRPRRRVVF